MTVRQEVLRIVIVGNGASGVLAAVHLLLAARGPLSLAVVGSGRRGRGVAYGTSCPEHLLNVRAARMSALAEAPDHFLRWLGDRHPDAAFGPESFVPRAAYGRYLEETLERARFAADRAVRFEWIQDEAVDVEAEGDGLALWLRGRSAPLRAHRLVLAVGDAGVPPSRPFALANPWSEGGLADLDPCRPILVLGTGLTMVDVTLALRARGHVGGVVAVSRRGVLPRAHGAACACRTSRVPRHLPATARGLLRAVRAGVGRAEADGCGWRCVVDALRTGTPHLWQALPPAEQARFLRHVRVYWDAHRHRMPLVVAEHIDRLRREGYLRVLPGRLAALEWGSGGCHVRIASRGEGTRHLLVQRAFDATGRYGTPASVFLARLQARGLVRPDVHGLGWQAAPDGRLSTEPRLSGRLWTLGAPLRGVLWETTAIPEIRQQAAALAERLLQPEVTVAPLAGGRPTERSEAVEQ